jgi:hypothetical protein
MDARPKLLLVGTEGTRFKVRRDADALFECVCVSGTEDAVQALTEDDSIQLCCVTWSPSANDEELTAETAAKEIIAGIDRQLTCVLILSLDWDSFPPPAPGEENDIARWKRYRAGDLTALAGSKEAILENVITIGATDFVARDQWMKSMRSMVDDTISH